ncbi:hypothetical protein LCGC14_2650350 [marine sediment metagenome]|uniref:Uncharacterized protein n=1 Tax=marine sediment metagenome TaxID=412755 RepID=A0A0F8ZUW6_9ZZZZ
MSELDLLADCLKDATKERDELAAALEQAQNVIDAASTSVNIDRRDDLVKWFQRLAITLDAQTAGDSAPLDGLKPAHECEKIASAIMAEGRDWWVGKLTKPVPGHEIETHCLHLTTPLKDVVFLVNDADFQWLTVLGRAACGPISERWLESVTRGAIKRAVLDGENGK